jgi:hypothetical protein
MKRAGCLLFVLVLAVIAWDQYRIEMMRRQLEQISSKIRLQNGSPAAKGKSDLVTAMAETERYARRAKQLLDKKKVAQAQAELDKALKSIRSANTVSRDIVGDAAQFLGTTRDKAIKLFQDTYKEISQEAKPKKQDATK